MVQAVFPRHPSICAFVDAHGISGVAKEGQYKINPVETSTVKKIVQPEKFQYYSIPHRFGGFNDSVSVSALMYEEFVSDYDSKAVKPLDVGQSAIVCHIECEVKAGTVYYAIVPLFLITRT